MSVMGRDTFPPGGHTAVWTKRKWSNKVMDLTIRSEFLGRDISNVSGCSVHKQRAERRVCEKEVSSSYS